MLLLKLQSLTMHHVAPHPWHLHFRGSLHVIQGWLLRDRQRVLQGRYERLLGEIGQVHQRACAGTAHRDERVAAQQQFSA